MFCRDYGKRNGITFKKIKKSLFVEICLLGYEQQLDNFVKQSVTSSLTNVFLVSYSLGKIKVFLHRCSYNPIKCQFNELDSFPPLNTPKAT